MSTPADRTPNLHAGQPVYAAGTPLDQATGAIVLLHGRGGNAQEILTLAGALAVPGCAYLAPQAAGNTWYPQSFLAPLTQNEPWLSSALALVGATLDHAAEAGIPPERMALVGFSQGACLTLEYAARNARRYAGVIAFTGGLIGPDGTPRQYPGTLGGTRVFIGGSDIDFHVPLARMEESAQILERLGGVVDLRVYPGMGHTINADEIDAARAILAGLTASDVPGRA
jgi:predicted esterase